MIYTPPPSSYVITIPKQTYSQTQQLQTDTEYDFQNNEVDVSENFNGTSLFSGDNLVNTKIKNAKINMKNKSVTAINVLSQQNLLLENVEVYNVVNKWAIRIGSPVLSSNLHINDLVVHDTNTGTLEQLIFYGQRGVSINNPVFYKNTNNQAYQVLSYYNNEEVRINDPVFYENNANSIGIMETKDIDVNNISISQANTYRGLAIINSENVEIDGFSAFGSSNQSSFIEFFDRELGPDGNPQLVDNTNDVVVKNGNIKGFYGAIIAQKGGLFLGTNYTMGQNNIRFESINISGGTAPIRVGIDHSSNYLTNWTFDDVDITNWNGTNTGAYQFRGYVLRKMNGMRVKYSKITASTGNGANSAIRAINSDVLTTSNSYVGTFTSYGATSNVNGTITEG